MNNTTPRADHLSLQASLRTGKSLSSIQYIDLYVFILGTFYSSPLSHIWNRSNRLSRTLTTLYICDRGSSRRQDKNAITSIALLVVNFIIFDCILIFDWHSIQFLGEHSTEDERRTRRRSVPSSTRVQKCISLRIINAWCKTDMCLAYSNLCIPLLNSGSPANEKITTNKWQIV